MLVALVLCLAFTGCSSGQTVTKKEPVLPTQTQTVPLVPIDNTTQFEGKTMYDYYMLNRDSIGWLKVNGIKTDNVVMLTKDLVYDTNAKGEKKYIYHNFEGERSSYGELYLDPRCYVNQNDISQNVTVYGHHMRDGTMLAGLEQYRNKSHFDQYQYFEFTTLWGTTYYYRVFAVFQVNLLIKEEREFEFRLPDFEDQADFMEMVNNVKERSLYDTGVEVKENDKIMTLYTCTYPTGNPSVDDARLMVVGRICTEEEIASLQQTA